MSHDLARPRRLSPIDAAVDAALGSFMGLTSDVLLTFTRTGEITMANDVARELLPIPSADPSILDVFPAGRELGAYQDVTDDLPFGLDGQVAHVTCAGADGRTLDLDVRARRISVNRDLFVMAATPVDGRRLPSRELSELVSANKRLSGTLDVILGTIEAQDIMGLCDRVLSSLEDMLDADAAVMYLAERRSMRLAAGSAGADEQALPAVFATLGSVAELVSAHGRTVRYHLQPLGKRELREHEVAERTLSIDETGALLSVNGDSVLPYASAFAVPIIFGDQVIELIFVGWGASRALDSADARLLDAVAQYLSTQIMGMLSAMRSKRETELRQASTRLRDELAASEPGSDAWWDALREAAEVLSCDLVPLVEDEGARTARGDFPHAGTCELPLSLDELERGRAGSQGTVVEVTPHTDLGGWLASTGESGVGVLVDPGLVGGQRLAWLFLGREGAPMLTPRELSFCRGIVDAIRTQERGEQLRTHDRRISQALQQGMRNQLQHVEGICAHDVYSSATRDAFVGGDFYDLIRLPDRRACVVMGDVSGKGVQAAATSAAVKCALGAYAWQGLGPAHMVGMLNQFLLGFSRLETFATLFVGIVDLGQGRLTYCSAGHPPALLMRAGGSVLEALNVQSGVVGAFEDMAYRDGEVELMEGDTLLLYTDGTTEARAKDGSFFGEDGLRDALMDEDGSADELLEHLLARLDEFTSNQLDDDVALVSLRFDEVG